MNDLRENSKNSSHSLYVHHLQETKNIYSFNTATGTFELVFILPVKCLKKLKHILIVDCRADLTSIFFFFCFVQLVGIFTNYLTHKSQGFVGKHIDTNKEIYR